VQRGSLAYLVRSFDLSKAFGVRHCIHINYQASKAFGVRHCIHINYQASKEATRSSHMVKNAYTKLNAFQSMPISSQLSIYPIPTTHTL